MSDHPASPLPDALGLARALVGAESELSREARILADEGGGEPEAWLSLIERVAVLLRSTARDLEIGPDRSGPAAPDTRTAVPGPALPPAAQRPAHDPVPASRAEVPTLVATSADGVISGTASVVPVSDLLAFLSGLRRSGMLWVETEREDFLVQLQEGAVVYAQGDNPPEGELLGEILIAEGGLARESLEEALNGAAQEHEVLGAFLVREGLITQAALTHALATQVQLIFDRMFGSVDARWRFEDGVRMVDSTDVWMNVIQLLLESARASDESHARATLDLKLPLARAS